MLHFSCNLSCLDLQNCQCQVKKLCHGGNEWVFVTYIDRFRDFTPPDLPEPEAEMSKSAGDEGFQPPSIQEMHSVTSAMLPVFKPAGYR